ncbi:universal stress protein [Pseudonocardia lacus]|uniref:universal stress protein n=1 Tax=Pseudonocardia lacus TaxID=2835865 RepID=UPI001BDD6395|nr:universal stress protein [Pseudonocardia lacus]
MTYRRGTVTLLGPDDTVRIGGPRRHEPPRVVAALHELPGDGPVLAEAVAAARRMGGELVLVHAVPLSFAERSVGLEEAVRRGERMLAAAAASAAAAGVAPKEALLVRVRPHELVGAPVEADLLVIGGPPADDPQRLGPVTRSAARYAPCALLVVPRP